ncbi:hypothetical protein J5N97_019947 [Dioscorea zingiberensis]|uniref:Uncharacterized protein n=1 Tax=Dioscorea zingiberensis TaxID=325984 RepID=A0A9D5HDC3_9LILI|nr:hypothetical protein J5N97_019947 [Dioscorea zingiberensis]
MPATDYQGSSAAAPFASLGRSILSLRRDQAHPVDGNDNISGPDRELDAFQRHVADLFQELSAGEDFLSIAWTRRLLDTFLICLEEFRAVLFCRRSAGPRPQVDRLVADFFDRAVKALDVCNAIRDGIEQVRQWGKHLEIVSIALGKDQKVLGEGQLRRSKKALTDLTLTMLDEKDAGSSVFTHRNRSFGRAGHTSGKDHHHQGTGHSRSLSWSVSRSWSAARQLQAIGNNLTAPRGHEVLSTNGFAVFVYTMNTVLLFVMWALVAAIPCHDRGLNVHFSIPRSFVWAAPISSLHERITEESKKKDKRNSSGLLKEINQIDKCGRHLLELLDVIQFPMAEEKEVEMRQDAEELAQVCDAIKHGLNPMERQVREVFHRIVRSRTDGLDCSAMQS